MTRASRLGWVGALAIAMAACGGSPGDDASSAAGGGGTSSSHVAATTSTAPPTPASTGAGEADACATLEADYQSALETLLTVTSAPGGTLAVHTEACGDWKGAAGTSEPGVAMDPDMVLGMGSVTKTFVASAFLEAAKAGLVDLDGPLSDYQPDFPNAASITLRMLLNHTSGIADFTTTTTFLDAIEAQPGRVWMPQELVDIAAMQPPLSAPGAAWHYANTNYVLAGMALEAATGANVASLIRGELLDPLALTSTSFGGEEPIVGDLAHCFIEGEDVTGYFDWSGFWTAGAMVSSASDLAAWARALYGGQAIDADLLAEMTTGAVPTTTPGWTYGLGVLEMDAASEGAACVGHDGAIPAYRAWMVYFPATKASFGFMINDYAATAAGMSDDDLIVSDFAAVVGEP
ncbi:MAG TPA: serine hydrolase domain-containing protein [Byssovorax sp.]|jgi:D-alanyl-D-alanine carboxypeptidase